MKIKGKIIKGDGYGRKIGFPTVNLSRNGFSRLKQKPAFGIYAGTVSFLNKSGLPIGTKMKAGVVIGPKDKNGIPKVEAHILGFEGNAYGRKAIFEIRKFIRTFKKFKNKEELIIQIKKDIKYVHRNS